MSSRRDFAPINMTWRGCCNLAETMYYDDNVFYLNEIISNLDDALKLDIDSDLFLDKFVEDIMFVESILEQLYISLKENDLLLRRPEHLKRIMRSKYIFAELLNSIMNDDSDLGKNLHPFYQKFRELVHEQRDHINEIRNLLSEATTVTQHEDMVSQEEFRILLEDNDTP